MNSIRILCASLIFSSLATVGAWAQPAPATPTPLDPAATKEGAVEDPAAATTPPPAPDLPDTSILPTVDKTSTAAVTLTGSLEAGRVASIIQGQGIDTRDTLLKELTDRVQEADRRVSEMRQRANGMSDADRESLKQAEADYEKAKARLNETIEAARSVDQSGWDRVRASLASEYAFFVSSVGSLEVVLP